MRGAAQHLIEDSLNSIHAAMPGLCSRHHPCRHAADDGPSGLHF
jgi:hypothetical protein